MEESGEKRGSRRCPSLCGARAEAAPRSSRFARRNCSYTSSSIHKLGRKALGEDNSSGAPLRDGDGWRCAANDIGGVKSALAGGDRLGGLDGPPCGALTSAGGAGCASAGAGAKKETSVDKSVDDESAEPLADSLG